MDLTGPGQDRVAGFCVNTTEPACYYNRYMSVS